MPLPNPVLYPPFNIVRLSHVELSVTDIDASRRFYADTLGLHVTLESQDTLYLRAMEVRSRPLTYSDSRSGAKMIWIVPKHTFRRKGCRCPGSSASFRDARC